MCGVTGHKLRSGIEELEEFQRRIMITSLKIEFKRDLKGIKGVIFVWLFGWLVVLCACLFVFYLYEREIMKQ